VRLQLVLQAQQLRALAPLLREPEPRLVMACWLWELQPGVPAERQPELVEQQKRLREQEAVLRALPQLARSALLLQSLALLLHET
jgi:hypothetical protein